MPQARAVVVGAGPVGALAALHLRAGGYAVTVFERRSQDIHAAEVRRGRRSYSIVLNERALRAMEPVEGLRERVCESGVKIEGTCRHSSKGYKARLGGMGKPGEAVSILRDDLVDCLVNVGKARGVEYRTGTRVVDLDLEGRTLTTLFGESGDREGRGFDLCVVADGVYGKTKALVRQGSRLQSIENEDGMEYKIVKLPNIEDFFEAPEASELESDPRFFRFFAEHAPEFSMLAPPRKDGRLRGVLITPSGGHQKHLGDAASVTATFAKNYHFIFGPKGPPGEVIDDLLKQPTSVGGVTTVCNKYDAGGCCVLIGDAAHSCWASLGQSANCGMESVAVLAKALFSTSPGEQVSDHGPPIGSVLSLRLSHYTALRKPDAVAVGQLSERGFGNNERVMTKKTIARIAVMVMMSKLLPFATFFKPALFDLGNASRPYSAVLKKQFLQDRVANGMFIILILAATLCVLSLMQVL